MIAIILAAAAIDQEVIPPLWRILAKFAYFAGLAAVLGSTVVHVATVRSALRERSTDFADRELLQRRSAQVIA
jgi:copper transport protein